jgi:YesN/AraC family two-component response regulator
MLLDSVGGFDVVGQAKNGLAVLDLVQKVQPQVDLVDLMMPCLNG